MSSPPVSCDNLDTESSYVLVRKLKEKVVDGSFSSVKSSIGLEDASEEQLVFRVNNLVRENEELKEILRKNSDVLQKYFEELAVIKEKQQERTNQFVLGHNQARNLVRKLRDKNSNLKNELLMEKKKVTELETQIALSGASSDLCEGASTLKEELKRVQTENLNLKAENETLSQNINMLKSIVQETNQMDANSETWKALESLNILSADVRSSVGSKAQEPLSIGSLKDQCTKSAIDKEILKVDYDKLQIEKSQVDEQFNMIRLENSRLLTNNQHLMKEKEELCQMLTEEKANNIANEEKLNKVLSEKFELEQAMSTLQQQLEVEKGRALEINIRNQELEKQTKEYETQLEKISETNVEFIDAHHKNKELVEKIRELERDLEQGKKAAEAAFEFDDDNQVVKEKFDALKKQLWYYQENESKVRDKEEELAVKEREIQKVYDSNTQLHLRLQEAERKASELHKLNVDLQYSLEQKNLQIEELAQQLEDFRGVQFMQEETLRGQVVQLIDDNKGYEQRYLQLEEQLREQRKQADGLIESLRTHLATTETELKKAKEQLDEHRKEREDVLAQNEQLMTEYDELLRSFKNTIDGNKKKQDSTQTEVAGYKARLESLNVELCKVQQLAQTKHEECGVLERQLQETKGQLDSIPVLRQQIEVYQNDFNAEREAREKQHNEILALRRQVTQLCTDNRRIQDELDTFNNSQMAEMQRRHGNHGFLNNTLNPTSAAAQGGELDNHVETGGTFLRRGSAAGSPEDPQVRPATPQNYQPVVQGTSNAGNEQNEDWICPTCRQDFPDFQILQMHAVECNTIPPEVPQAPRGSSQPQCPKCENFFPDLDTLQIHVEDCIDFN